MRPGDAARILAVAKALDTGGTTLPRDALGYLHDDGAGGLAWQEPAASEVANDSTVSGSSVADALDTLSAGGGGSSGPQQLIRTILKFKNGIFLGNMTLENRTETHATDPYYGVYGIDIHAAMVLPANGVIMPRLTTFGPLPSGKSLRCSTFEFNVVNTAATQRLLVANGSSADTTTGSSGETFITLPQLTSTVASTGSDLSVATSDNHGANTGVKTTAGGLFIVDMWLTFFYV